MMSDRAFDTGGQNHEFHRETYSTCISVYKLKLQQLQKVYDAFELEITESTLNWTVYGYQTLVSF